MGMPEEKKELWKHQYLHPIIDRAFCNPALPFQAAVKTLLFTVKFLRLSVKGEVLKKA